MARLKKMDGVQIVAPEGTPYRFPAVKVDDWKLVRALVDEGVLVTPGSAYGPITAPFHFRFTFLQSKEILSRALDKIESVIRILT